MLVRSPVRRLKEKNAKRGYKIDIYYTSVRPVRTRGEEESLRQFGEEAEESERGI